MMTDKQIIIDGVDVSGCEHLYKEIDCLAHIDFSECCEGYNPSYGYCPNTDCYYKQLKRKEEELQAQRNFTTQEQRKIYCVAYDKTCETGNECKQKKCVFKDRLKYKQALDEIEKYLDIQQKYFDGEDYHNLLDIINKVKEE